MMRVWVLSTFAALLLGTNADEQLQELPPPTVQQAVVWCDAAYNAPCARTNSRFLATTVADTIFKASKSNSDLNEYFQQITDGKFNLDVGFYPFVIRTADAVCVAHGANSGLVSLTLDEILRDAGILYVDATALHDRFAQGGWVQYVWNDDHHDGNTLSKLAYIAVSTDYYLGVGYVNRPLPVDLPCTDKNDAWCSLTNVRSLIGRAQFRLQQAETVGQFEATLYDISYDPVFRVDDGFYLFMYDADSGELVAHGALRDSFGLTLGEIFVREEIGTANEGIALHEQFAQAVALPESTAWVQHQWRNSLDQDSFTKVSYLVAVDFLGTQYYLGAGFENTIAISNNLAPCTASFNLPCSFQTAVSLASHTLSYVIASPDAVQDRFGAISRDPQFQVEDFYVFAYSFDGACVAHGLNEDFVGLTLDEVIERLDIQLDSAALHNQFRAAAQQGGGWVVYDWLVPGVENSTFEKIAYMFQINIYGQSYYAGVGFNNLKSPVALNTGSGSKLNGDPISCSSHYDSPCSEQNTMAVLGQSLSDLTLATSDVALEAGGMGLEDVLLAITNQSGPYTVNDFYVSVFSVDGEECLQHQDKSGCCIAHGLDPSFESLTWQEILDVQEISSIRGPNLHDRLIHQANAGGGSIEYAWFGTSTSGVAQRKRASVSRFRSSDKDYYVVSEYFLTDQPPTCDDCPRGTECTSGDQPFCQDRPEPPITKEPIFLSVLILFSLAVPTFGIFYRRQKYLEKLKRMRLAAELEQMATSMKEQMQGMYKVMFDMPYSNVDEYQSRVGNNAKGSSQPCVFGVWYWEEDSCNLHKHHPKTVLDGTNFVAYGRDLSGQIEHAHRRFVEGSGFNLFRVDLNGIYTWEKMTGWHYDIDFGAKKQRNTKSKHERPVRREEIDTKVETNAIENLPLLPDDIDFESEKLLPTYVGQVIQVSKVHPAKEWLFGNVLYDPILETLDKTRRELTDSDDGLNNILSHALQGRPTSGWFPRAVTEQADVGVMQTLLDKLGGKGLDTLTVPSTWDESSGNDRIIVPTSSKEYNDVTHYFLAALYSQRDKVTVEKVERIQNKPLWQSYAVKLQTMKARYESTDNAAHLVNNTDPNPDACERQWLFHGTTPDVIPKIEKQGFNRSFAGRNAVAYGKGVYFARDASYSMNYASADAKGMHYMFLCRVAVGDWSKGSNGQLTPAPKPHNNIELFDSTADSIGNPSIFVVYNDAQAYPEYIISFKHLD